MDETPPSGTLKTMLYLNGVSVSFDGFKALNNLSIIVHPAEMLAIIGPNVPTSSARQGLPPISP